MKTKTTHTPGPWRIGDAGHTVFGPPNGNPSPKTIARELSRADARLIAAAPSMLLTLLRLQDELSGIDKEDLTHAEKRMLSMIEETLVLTEGE